MNIFKFHLLSFLSLLLFQSVVFADDFKTSSGAACQVMFGQSDAMKRTESGEMYNISSQDEWWTCPILRDYQQFELNQVRVYIRDVVGTSRCELVVNDKYGFMVQSQLRLMSNNTNPSFRGVTYFQWDRSDLSNYGNYFLRCLIPAQISSTQRSGIASYYWAERDYYVAFVGGW